MNSPELREAYNANLPKVTQYYTELGQDQRAVREVQGAARPRRSSTRCRARAQDASSRTSCATSASAAPSCRRTRRRASWQIQEELAQLVVALLRQRARRDQRLRALRRPTRSELAGIPAGRARRPRARRRRRTASDGWKFTLHVPSLPAGDAVRRRPRAARAHVPRLRDARLRVRQAGMGQHAAHRATSSSCAARWRGCSASRNYAEVSLAPKMAESPRAGARLPATTSRAARGRSPSATSTSCATSRATSSGSPSCEAWDLAYASREAARRALRVLRPGSEAVLPRGRGARRACSALVETLYGADDRAGRRRRCGTRTCASSTMRDARRRRWSASSTSTSTRATSKRGGAWMDDAITRRRAGGARADAGRLPQLQLLARRSAASPRSSRTTK